MHIAVQHTRFFRAVYKSSPQQCYVLSGINIRIAHRIAVVASKHFALPVTYMQTLVALFTCVVRRYGYQFHTCKQTLIRQELTKLVEIPFANSCSKFLAFFIGGKTDAFEFFNSNSFSFYFGNRYNTLADGVINNGTGCPFPSRKPFQNTLGVLCAFGLERTPYFLSLFSIGGKFIRRKCLSVAKSCQFQKPHIHTQEAFHVLHIIFHHINCLKQVEFTFSVQQICFSFDVRKIIRIVADKRHFQPAANRPDRDSIIRFIGQDAAIIRDRAKWFEGAFHFPIQFVSISHLRYATNYHLTTQIRSTFNGMVAGIVEFKLLKGFLLPSYIRNQITSLVRFFDSLKQTFSLFIRRQQLYFQVKFHNTNIRLFQVRENYLVTLKAMGVVAYLPTTQSDGWVSRSFL